MKLVMHCLGGFYAVFFIMLFGIQRSALVLTALVVPSVSVSR